MVLIIYLAVHLKNKHDFIFVSDEPFSVVESDSLVNLEVNQDFLEVCLVVLSVGDGLQRLGLFEEREDIQLGGVLLECQSNELVISLLQQVESIFVSEHDELELSQNLSIDNS